MSPLRQDFGDRPPVLEQVEPTAQDPRRCGRTKGASEWTTSRCGRRTARPRPSPRGSWPAGSCSTRQLARIEAANPALNAVVSVDAERARAAAGAADEAVARGESIGPLHGVPVTLKDAYEVAGWTSTGGSTQRSGHVPDRDAPAVAALRQAGIVLLGRTNVPEWSGDLQTYNDVFGVTNNPWDTSRTPGGSSGGAGVAVATGMSSFELGTDIGGSIRVPAAFNGVCGHKPTWGVVSTAGYLDHAAGSQLPRSVNVFGPLARSVDDLEIVLDVVAGPHPRHTRAWRLELPPAPRHDGRRHPLRGLVRRAVMPDRPGRPHPAGGRRRGAGCRGGDAGRRPARPGLVRGGLDRGGDDHGRDLGLGRGGRPERVRRWQPPGLAADPGGQAPPRGRLGAALRARRRPAGAGVRERGVPARPEPTARRSHRPDRRTRSGTTSTSSSGRR